MENIKVAICVRGDGGGVLYDEEKKTAQVHCLTYSFDHVFGPPLDPVYIYDTAISSVVHRVMSGYNACLFPWGAAGSGKTQMMDALSHLIVERLFKTVEHKRNASSTNSHFLIHASVLEICDVDILDLLARKEEQNSPLQMRGDDANVYLDNITLVETMCPDHLYNVFELARKRRNVPRPNVVERHAIYTIIVESTQFGHNNATKKRHVGRLNLIDIHGERKDADTPNVVTGAVMQIVNSLITAQRHIPYQASILTKLMQDALGGNCATLMLGCVDASEEAVASAAATLRFAARIMKVQNAPKLNVAVESKLAQYEDELDSLKALYDKQTERDVDQNWRLDVLRKIAALESRIQGAVSKDARQAEVHEIQNQQAFQNGASPENRSSHPDHHQVIAAQHSTDGTASGPSPTARGMCSRAFDEHSHPPEAPMLDGRENVINEPAGGFFRGNPSDEPRQDPERPHSQDHTSPLASKKREFDSLLENLHLTNEELRVAKNMLQVRTEQLNAVEQELREMKKRESVVSRHSDLLPATIDELVNVLVERDPSCQWLCKISAPAQALLSAKLGTNGSEPAQSASKEGRKFAPIEKLAAARADFSTSSRTSAFAGGNAPNNARVPLSTSCDAPRPGVERVADTAVHAAPSSNLSAVGPASEFAQQYRTKPTIDREIDTRRANSVPRVVGGVMYAKLLQNPPWAMTGPPNEMSAAQQPPLQQRNTAPRSFGATQQHTFVARDTSRRPRSVSPLPTGTMQLQPQGALNVSPDGRWSMGRVNLSALTLTKRDLSPMSSRHKSPIIKLLDTQPLTRLKSGPSKPNAYDPPPNYHHSRAQSPFAFLAQNLHRHHSARASDSTNPPIGHTSAQTKAPPDRHHSARAATTTAPAVPAASVAPFISTTSAYVSGQRSVPVPQKLFHQMSGLRARGLSCAQAAPGAAAAIPAQHPFGTGAEAYSGAPNLRSRAL